MLQLKGIGLTKRSSDFCPPGCYAMHVCDRVPKFLKMLAKVYPNPEVIYKIVRVTSGDTVIFIPLS